MDYICFITTQKGQLFLIKWVMMVTMLISLVFSIFILFLCVYVTYSNKTLMIMFVIHIPKHWNPTSFNYKPPHRTAKLPIFVPHGVCKCARVCLHVKVLPFIPLLQRFVVLAPEDVGRQNKTASHLIWQCCAQQRHSLGRRLHRRGRAMMLLWCFCDKIWRTLSSFKNSV